MEAAADGDAALDLLLGADPYDLIVLDVMLPKRDGFAVLKAARQSGSSRPSSCSLRATASPTR